MNYFRKFTGKISLHSLQNQVKIYLSNLRLKTNLDCGLNGSKHYCNKNVEDASGRVFFLGECLVNVPIIFLGEYPVNMSIFHWPSII